MKKQKSNVCGIVGLSTGWLMPLAGIVLGIIALARKEKTPTYGIFSIVFGVLCWVIWTILLTL